MDVGWLSIEILIFTKKRKKNRDADAKPTSWIANLKLRSKYKLFWQSKKGENNRPLNWKHLVWAFSIPVLFGFYIFERFFGGDYFSFSLKKNNAIGRLVHNWSSMSSHNVKSWANKTLLHFHAKPNPLTAFKM